jgi:DNA-binding response OmpR family regulator
MVQVWILNYVSSGYENMKVLLIEDDPTIIESVKITLQLRWPEANLISTFLGEKGIQLARQEHLDLIILDLGLPDIDGFEVLQQIRTFSNVPVVINTVMGDEMNVIKGLELGADDYITKPFSPGEFLARLKAVTRRSEPHESTNAVGDKPYFRGKLRIDVSTQEVSVGGNILKLSPREFELLSFLEANAGKVLSNQVLLEEVFPEQSNDVRFLKVYMNKLIEKLEEDPDTPKIILNEGGQGYKFIQQ